MRSTAESIPVTVYKLAKGHFAEVPHPTTRSLNDNTSPPLLEDIPSTPVRQGTPGLMQDQPQRIYLRPRRTGQFPLLQSPHLLPTIKTEEPPKIAAIPHAMVMPKQTTEICSWGLHCPIYKNEEEHEEDWDGDLQNQPRMHPKTFSTPSCRMPSVLSHKAFSAPNHRAINPLSHRTFSTPAPATTQPQSFQHLQPQNSQQSFDIPDRYTKQIKLRREWEEKIEQLNEKYKLDYYSSSDSDSDSEPEPDYRYEHKYETLI